MLLLDRNGPLILIRHQLNLYGNERNWLGTYFNIGIIIGTIPSQMIQLRYIRPSYWIPFCEFAWSVLVMAMAAAKNIETVSLRTSIRWRSFSHRKA